MLQKTFAESSVEEYSEFQALFLMLSFIYLSKIFDLKIYFQLEMEFNFLN